MQLYSNMKNAQQISSCIIFLLGWRSFKVIKDLEPILKLFHKKGHEFKRFYYRWALAEISGGRAGTGYRRYRGDRRRKHLFGHRPFFQILQSCRRLSLAVFPSLSVSWFSSPEVIPASLSNSTTDVIWNLRVNIPASFRLFAVDVSSHRFLSKTASCPI